MLRPLLLLLLPGTMMMGIIPGSEGFLVACSPTGRARPGPAGRAAKDLPTRERLTTTAVAAADSGASVPGAGPSSSAGTCTCRNCKQQFRRDDNEAGACSFHPGLFSGRLNRVNDVDTSGLEYFWSCCGQPDKEHPGCATGRHASYDDPEEGGIRSPLTGSKLR